jgi:hypothetical protein
MNRAGVKRLRRLFNPASDGITRKLVACEPCAGGVLCGECGAVHADAEEVERLHGGPGVLVIEERIVEPATMPA